MIFRTFFLLFTASVRSRSPGPPEVPGVFGPILGAHKLPRHPMSGRTLFLVWVKTRLMWDNFLFPQFNSAHELNNICKPSACLIAIVKLPPCVQNKTWQTIIFVTGGRCIFIAVLRPAHIHSRIRNSQAVPASFIVAKLKYLPRRRNTSDNERTASNSRRGINLSILKVGKFSSKIFALVTQL